MVFVCSSSPDRRQAAQTKITRIRRHLGFNSIDCYNSNKYRKIEETR